MDVTTGDYQFGSRTYDPTKPSFLTPDSYRAGNAAQNLSIGVDPLTKNRYSYVNGDPVNLVDPNGHKFCRVGNPSDECDAYRGGDGGSTGASPGLTRKYAGASGGELVKDCYLNLDCQVGDFEAMTIGQRRVWIAFFQAKYGRNNDLPFNGWFNNVLGTLHAFQDRGVITPGSWTSISDAATLEGIQTGFHAFSSGADTGSNPGAAKWRAFFERFSKDPDNTKALEHLWGQAEKASIHYGAVIADMNTARPKWATEFVRIGDEYRDALGGNDATAFARDSAFVYGNAFCWWGCGALAVAGTQIGGAVGLLPNDALLDPRFSEEFIHGTVSALLHDLRQ